MGKVSYISPNAQVDFFAYSIGAFLSQILFIANPNGIVSNSRLFMFCGGAFFSEMNGVSKMIMDETAFEKISNYYNDEFVWGLRQFVTWGNVAWVALTALGYAWKTNFGGIRDITAEVWAAIQKPLTYTYYFKNS